MTTSVGVTEINGLLSDLEDLWRGIDSVFDSFGPADWSRKHGPDWVFADLPYHLAYFDRDIVASGIERGADVPRDQQKILPTFKELNAWNDAMFAKRPAGQTPQQSVEEMQASREAIRRIVRGMSDADLARPVFIPICGCGWLTARHALMACRGHTWNHHTELRLRLERSEPQPCASATHGALAFYSGFVPYLTLDRQAAKGGKFTIVMDYTGPGGGAWTVRVADGGCSAAEERDAGADVVMTQAPETFVKVFAGIAEPPALIQRGEIKIQGVDNMARYGELFPPPSLDRVIPPMGAAAP